MMTQELWMTTVEAANALGISRQALANRIDKGGVPTQEAQTGRGRGGKTILVSAEYVRKTLEISKQPKQVLGNGDQSNQSNPQSNQSNLQSNQSNDTQLAEISAESADQSKSQSNRCKETAKAQRKDSTKDTNPLLPVASTVTSTALTTRSNASPTNIYELERSLEWIDKPTVASTLGISKQAVDYKITSEGWMTITVPDPTCRARTYVSVSCLPAAAQVQWRELQIARWQPNLPALHQEQKVEWEGRTESERARARAQYAIVMEWRRTLAQAKTDGKPVMPVERAFEQALADCRILPDLTTALGGRVSAKSIRRWDKTLRDGGDALFPVGLLPERTTPRGRPPIRLDEAEVNMVKITVASSGLDLMKVYRRLVESDWGGVERISYATFCRRYKPDDVVRAIVTGPKAVNNLLRPHVLISKADLIPGNIWLGDGHRMNNACQSPFWRHPNAKYRFMIHPYLHMWIDQMTWCVVGWSLAATENTHAVMISYGMGIERFGVPDEKLRTDNGPAWKNLQTWPDYYASLKKPNAEALKMIAEGRLGIFKEMAGITPDFEGHPFRRSNGIPGNSEGKEIENAFHTILEEFEQTTSLWTGHTKADVPERLSGKPTAKLMNQVMHELLPWNDYVQALGDYLDRWNHTPRIPAADGSLLSPIDAYNTVEHRHVDPQHILETYYRYPVPAVVTRDGIEVNGIPYWHPGIGVGLHYGEHIRVHFHEHFLDTVRLVDSAGRLLPEPATAIPASSHVDDEKASAAIADATRRFKNMLGNYAQAHGGLKEAMEAQERLQIVDKERGELPAPRTPKALPAAEVDPVAANLAKVRRTRLEPTTETPANEMDRVFTPKKLRQLGIG